jgi:hypothetical protein
MANRRGTSSRSTKPTRNRCPICPDGTLEKTLVSKSFRGILVPDLLADRCHTCGELMFSEHELERVRLFVARRAQEKAA